MRLSRSRQAFLPQATAEQILANAFSACRREPNSVPLEALTSYSNYRKERYALQRTLILLVLTLFMLLPLLFMAADISISQVNSGSDENPVYAISIHTRLPIRQIEARLGGQTVPLYEISPGSYTAIPRANGEMRIAATLVNRQRTDAVVEVLRVDTDMPTLVSTEIGDNSIRFFVRDEGSGIDYERITVTDDEGHVLSPLRLEPESGCVVLPYPERTLHVSIPDLRGNVLRVDLKPQE